MAGVRRWSDGSGCVTVSTADDGGSHADRHADLGPRLIPLLQRLGVAIATATVKKHTVTLYDKLNVHSRRETVVKALTLGYVNA